MNHGIYEDMPAAQYHAIEAASNSRLSRLVVSPAHLRAYMEQPPKQTDAMVIGSAVHTLALEPHLWPALYAVAGVCSATTKGGAPCSNGGSRYLDGAWFCGVKGHAPDEAGDPGLTVLSAESAERCQRTAGAIRSHPRISKLLEAGGRAELSVVWTDEDTGLLCKARIDWLAETAAGGVALDIKTTTDASPRGFERVIADRGYHRQLAFYEEGLRAHGVELRHLVFAAVEKEPPFACAAYRLDDSAAYEGRAEYRTLLRQYAALIEKPREAWPAYGDDIMDLALPPWAYGRITEGVAA